MDRDVRESESFVRALDDREEHNCRPDTADHGEDLEKRAEPELLVMAAAEDVCPVMVQKRDLEKKPEIENTNVPTNSHPTMRAVR